MTPEQLSTITDHALAAAPPGPWEVHHDVDDTDPHNPHYYPFLTNPHGELDMGDEDVLRLAALAPALAAENKRLRATHEYEDLFNPYAHDDGRMT